MRFTTAAVVAAAVGSAIAQRPTNTSICDYYTTALLKTNNGTTQYTLLTLLVNTVVIGNYTMPNHNAVPGILAANATFNGKAVNLLQYFDGQLASSNVGGSAAAVNFLDDGGAAPLKLNKPANGTSSNQYFLLTHLYEFFGAALGCTQYGMSGFPAYGGDPSMYDVHKFMDLDENEVGYFIEQVGLAATSFGVTTADATAVGTLLGSVFGVKCAPAATVIPSAGPQLQSICVASSCMNATNANCTAYGSTAAAMPGNASTTVNPASTMTAAGGSGSSGSSSTSTSTTKSDATKLVSGALLGLAGAVAGFFALA